ncbi:hypothetical protein WUBG_15076, partial [Wuchereria bancrofti]
TGILVPTVPLCIIQFGIFIKLRRGRRYLVDIVIVWARLRFAFEEGKEDGEKKEEEGREDDSYADLFIFQGEPGDFRDLR